MIETLTKDQQLANQIVWTAQNKRKETERSDNRGLHRTEALLAKALATTTKTCNQCNESFEAYSWCANAIKHCPKCSESAERDFEADYQAKIMEPWERYENETEKPTEEKWKLICPPLYQATEIYKLPNQAAFTKLMQWQYGAKGALAHSTTGKGKSRSAWYLLRREYLAGRKVKALTPGSALHFAGKFSESSAAAERWVNGLVATDILLLDDCWKDNLSPGFEAALYSIIVRRTEALKPLIITTNDMGATIEQRFTADRGKPLVRRLREFCTAVSFE